jgi:hypothetical protein
VAISDAERASLTGFEVATVENIAAVMNRARAARPTMLDRDAPHRLGQSAVPIR